MDDKYRNRGSFHANTFCQCARFGLSKSSQSRNTTSLPLASPQAPRASSWKMLAASSCRLALEWKDGRRMDGGWMDGWMEDVWMDE